MKKILVLPLTVLVLAGCCRKAPDIFRNPDNAAIEAADGKTKFYVPARKITSEPGYHWFAYYDKIESDASSRYILSMKTGFEHRSPKGGEAIEIGMVDTWDDCRWIRLGESRALGWQQGCQLQFVPGSDNTVLWNDREGERFVTRIMNIETRETRTIPWTVYALSPDGKWAVTVDYSRVNEVRPGYGYAGFDDPNRDEKTPDDSGVWRVNLETGEAELIISIADVAAMLNPYDTETADAKHWFNHLLVNPDGTRFIFLHRWRYPDAERTEKYCDVGGWGTRMLTANMDGSDIRIIDPYNYTSHFIWRDADHILAWTELPEMGEGFFLFEDSATENVMQIGKGVMTRNGHCTYLPGNEWILNDTYPEKGTRLQYVYLYHVPTDERVPLGEFYSPVEYQGEWRCDTHPRSTQDGKYVIVDSPNWQGRQLYMLDVRGITAQK